MEPESVTLYGKKNFTDVIKLRILTWGNYVGPKCCHKCPYKKEAEGDLSIDRRKEGNEARCSASGFEVGGRDQEPIQGMQL